MDTYKSKWTRLQAGIFRLLSIKAGQRFNLRSVAKLLKVSPTAVSNSLIDLKKQGIIKVETARPMNLLSIELNRENQKVIDMKRIENLKMIYESGLVEFLEENFPGCTIVLFGSYSKGEDTYKSDLDIAIVGTKGKKIGLEKFEKIFEKTININYYESWNIDKHLRNNILNGIVLSGGVDL